MRAPSANLTLAAGLIGLSCAAWASTSVSSISDSVTTSVGSASASIQHSSRSSSGKADVAAGDYRIVAVAAAAEPAGHVRVTLQADIRPGLAADARTEARFEAPTEIQAGVPATATGERFDLVLPDRTVTQAGLQVGHHVRARARPYGVEFAAGPTHEAFYLVLHDASFRELRTQAVAR